MTAIECLRIVREATAGELAAVLSLPPEQVYEELMQARAAGTVVLDQQYGAQMGSRPTFMWRSV
jgi:predicted ArsR family transcriptional regulator